MGRKEERQASEIICKAAYCKLRVRRDFGPDGSRTEVEKAHSETPLEDMVHYLSVRNCFYSILMQQLAPLHITCDGQ